MHPIHPILKKSYSSFTVNTYLNSSMCEFEAKETQHPTKEVEK